MIKLNRKLRIASGKLEGVFLSKNEKIIEGVELEITGIVGDEQLWTCSPTVSGVEILYLKDDITMSALYITGILWQYKNDYTVENRAIVFRSSLRKDTIVTILGKIEE